MNRVVITGIGLVSPLGAVLNDVWAQLILGNSAVVVLPDSYNSLPCRIASTICNNTYEEIKSELNPNDVKTMSRASVLIMKAANDAILCSGLPESNKDKHHKYGVSIGIGFDGVSSSIDIMKFNQGTIPYSAVGPYALTRGLGNMPAAHLSVRYKFTGPSRSVNTACAASLHAIGDAYRAVLSGEADLMLAGGVEASISPWSVAAFSRIRALPTSWNDRPNAASRPFDIDRSGFVMAEGAGAMVLETLEHASYRGRRPLAEIIGFGQSCDAYSLVAPDSNGDGAYRAMKAAIESANIGPEQVSYINAHATSTPQGDILESQAIERLFGKRPLVSSFKGQLGHCLGGSGAVESVLAVQCLLNNQIPPNGNLECPDPKIRISLVPGGKKAFVWTDKSKIVVKNSFGFGGTNCSIVLRPYID